MTSLRTAAAVLFLTVIQLLTVLPAAGQQLIVELDHPVYKLLDTIELRTIAGLRHHVRPYSRQQIVTLLDHGISLSGLFTPGEIAVMQSFREAWSDAQATVFSSGAVTSFREDIDQVSVIGARFSTRLALPAGAWNEYDLRHSAEGYLEGSVGDIVSYRISGALRLDKLDPAGWPPYYFSVPGEGFYLFGDEGGSEFDSVRYSDGIASAPVIGFAAQPEFSLLLFDRTLQLRWGMFERDWGPGDGNLLLSRHARSFDAVEGLWQLSDSISYAFLTGTLTDYRAQERDRSNIMFTAKRISIGLPGSLTFGLSETVVWPKRFELGYFNPFMVTTLYQNILGDFDNMFAGIDIEWKPTAGLRFFLAWAADEMGTPDPRKWFTHARNIFGLQTGAEVAVPGIPFGAVHVQYTKLEPYFYTHYPQPYPTYTDPEGGYLLLDTSYRNKGEPLGYYLLPNSDEVKVSFIFAPASGTLIDLQFSSIRRDGQFGAGYDTYMDYAHYENGGYPLKQFGGQLIERTYVIIGSISYDLPGIPISGEFGCSYAATSSRSADYDIHGILSGFASGWELSDSFMLHFGLQVYY